MEHVFGWIGQIFQTLLRFFPWLVIVPATSAGVAFVRGRRVKEWGPGLHWYWPLVTTYKTIMTVRQTQRVQSKVIMTKDLKTVTVGALVTYHIDDVVSALAKIADLPSDIIERSQGAILSLVSERTMEEIQRDRLAFNAELSARMGEALNGYGVQVLQAVPAQRLQLGAARAGADGRLGGEVDEVRARGGLGDAGGPGVAVAVGVDDGGVRVLGAEAGVVREDDPGVHLQAGRGEGFGRLAVRVTGRPVAGLVRAQLTALPAVAGRVQHGRVLGGDDAVARVARGERARGVVGGGQRHLLHAERGDAVRGLRVLVDVPGVDERRRLHLPSSSSAYPRSISSASCFTWSSVGSCSGERTSPTSSPRSRTAALTSATA